MTNLEMIRGNNIPPPVITRMCFMYFDDGPELYLFKLGNPFFIFLLPIAVSAYLCKSRVIIVMIILIVSTAFSMVGL